MQSAIISRVRKRDQESREIEFTVKAAICKRPSCTTSSQKKQVKQDADAVDAEGAMTQPCVRLMFGIYFDRKEKQQHSSSHEVVTHDGNNNQNQRRPSHDGLMMVTSHHPLR